MRILPYKIKIRVQQQQKKTLELWRDASLFIRTELFIFEIRQKGCALCKRAERLHAPLARDSRKQ
jgi:hypothetical protein